LRPEGVGAGSRNVYELNLKMLKKYLDSE